MRCSGRSRCKECCRIIWSPTVDVVASADDAYNNVAAFERRAAHRHYRLDTDATEIADFTRSKVSPVCFGPPTVPWW